MVFQIKNSRSHVETATDRQERISWWSQERLRSARVMVVGAGALGNEAVKNLALLGVGYILIVDFDFIEISNLSRTALFRHEDLGKRKAVVAAQRARELNVEPGAIVDAIDGDVIWEVGLGVYRRMDIVLGCLDNLEARLAVNRACMLAGKPFIDGGIRGLAGSVYTFAPPFDSCFGCTTTKREREAAGARYDSCFQVLRRGYQAGRMATIQVTSALIAALQVEYAIKWLHGRLRASGTRTQYDGGNEAPYFEVTRILRRKGCECEHLQPLPEVKALPRSGSEVTLRECLALVEEAGIEEPIIKFPGSFAPFLFCGHCGGKTRLMLPTHRMSTEQLQCRSCDLPGDRESLQLMLIGDSQDLLDPDLADVRAELLDLSLRSLGFPLMHAMLVQDKKGHSHFFELSGDEEKILPGFYHERSSAKLKELKVITSKMEGTTE